MLETKEYSADFCVIGGGLAGLCAAVAAAREGAKVVLMQERPVLGGNASGEIRMWVCGAQGRNVRETGILEEINLRNLYYNPYKRYPIWDGLLWETVQREKNITLLLNCSCMDAEMKGNTIVCVTGWQMTTQRFCRVRARLFADCSGDSILAPLTGAKYRVGRESADEFDEIVSTKVADKKTMGMSCLIQAHKGTEPVTFAPPEFAKKITENDVRFRRPEMDSTYENFWFLELGGDRDSIGDTEAVRDELVALAYGMWDYVKNSGTYEGAEYWQLDFLGFLPGKRESRRMVGKYIMKQSDITENRAFDDVCAYGGWPLDDHDPAGFYYDGHPNTSYQKSSPFAIPYRCLYSDNIENLFFAGRNISMTHAAMSASRVMATCALCGQAVGTAAALCVRYDTTPDGLYRKHIRALQDTLLWNDCMLPSRPRVPDALTKKAALCGAPECIRDGLDRDNVAEFPFNAPVSYTFDKPTYVREARIVFDSDLDRETLPGDIHERIHSMRCNLLPTSPVMHLPTTLAKSFCVSAVLEDGTTQVLCGESNNLCRLVRINVDKYIKSISLTVTENHNGTPSSPHFEKARVFSFEITG